jgi:hypothetical protein
MMVGKRCNILFRLYVAIIAGLAACIPKQSDTALFLPPTNPVQQRTAVLPLVPQSPEPPAKTESILPSPTPLCTAGLTFLEDITIPDGTLVQPGDELDKRWLVENSGTCNWDRNYSLVLISGPGMGALQHQALFPARSGSSAIIRIIFTAPDEPGVYRSAWQARDPSGELFGDPFFIEIVVSSPQGSVLSITSP